jgi:cytochrome c553
MIRFGSRNGEKDRLRREHEAIWHGCDPDHWFNSNNRLRWKDNMKKTVMLALVVFAASFGLARAADVKENWDKNCAKCHGPDGKGDTKMGKKLSIKDYTDAKVQAGFKDEEAVKALKEGLKDKDGNTTMKAVEGMSDDEIKALVAYVRAFKK